MGLKIQLNLHQHTEAWVPFQNKDRLSKYLDLRYIYHFHIHIMGIPILVRQHLYTETSVKKVMIGFNCLWPSRPQTFSNGSINNNLVLVQIMAWHKTGNKILWWPSLLTQYASPGLDVLINPLRAKFFRGNVNIYLHFMSFLHTDKTHVVEIPPRVRQGPAYST